MEEQVRVLFQAKTWPGKRASSSIFLQTIEMVDGKIPDSERAKVLETLHAVVENLMGRALVEGVMSDLGADLYVGYAAQHFAGDRPAFHTFIEFLVRFKNGQLDERERWLFFDVLTNYIKNMHRIDTMPFPF